MSRELSREGPVFSQQSGSNHDNIGQQSSPGALEKQQISRFPATSGDYASFLGQQRNLEVGVAGNFSVLENAQSSSAGGYKNPWTSISRPMNGFIDIREDQWEQNELRKA